MARPFPVCVGGCAMDKIAELRQKSNKLPLLPGVYIMKNAAGEVIYVGKAKALKNRVSSYFSGEHLPKVAAMVSHVNDFDVIVAASEFEALVLENSLIKRHQPHYNILLRDDKSYPFLRLDEREEYPRFELVNRASDDGARYFGPFGGRYVSRSILETMHRAMQMPSCSRRFPRDIGKDRPCLNYHMKTCAGWCLGTPDAAAYRENIRQMARMLDGDAGELIDELEREMLQSSDELCFERAAQLRDRIAALRELSNRQHVIKSARTDTDAIGFCRGARTAFVVLHYTSGDLTDKDLELMPEPLEDDAAAVGALLSQYYAMRGLWPREILLPFEPEGKDALEQLLTEAAGRRVVISVPQRGDRRLFLAAAMRNAREESLRASTQAERRSKTLEWLQKMLDMETLPKRIESFDISNTGNTGIVASMVVFENGRPLKRAYRRFRMKAVTTQDDYASMFEAVSRRFGRWQDGDEKFLPLPDLLLIDGGEGQVGAAQEAMEQFGLSLPIFGMVKDDRHRTRALVTRDGREIGIQANPAVFALIGNIQEQTHHFAIEYHRSLRDGNIGSRLDCIEGVGPKRRAALLKHFKTIKAIRAADVAALSAVVPKNTAEAVWRHFHEEEEK